MSAVPVPAGHSDTNVSQLPRSASIPKELYNDKQGKLTLGDDVGIHAPNSAAVLMKVDDMIVKDIAAPREPRDHDVVVRMKSVGICGSDVHYWKKGSIGDFVVKAPMVIGHESAGVIVKVGAKVKHLRIGDRVAIEPGTPCRVCHYCKVGRYNLCPDIEFFATPPYDGSLCRYVVHPADLCYALPDNMSYDEGAMCEPLSVAVFACQRADMKPGMRIAVMGAGPIGIFISMVCKAYGADVVVITDVSKERCAAAIKYGATDALCVAGLSPEETAKGLVEKAGGPLDITFEACGIGRATSAALQATATGGCVCCVGLNEATMTLPLIGAVIREVDIRGVFRYKNTYPICISLIASGRVNVGPLITHRINLTDNPLLDKKDVEQKHTKEYENKWKIDHAKLIEGFEISRTGRDGAIKVMFRL